MKYTFNWSGLRNPVFSYQETDVRDPSTIYYQGKFYLYFTHDLRPDLPWITEERWATDLVITEDFLSYSSPKRVAPAPYCSPGNILNYKDTWYMVVQYYGKPPKPANLCLTKSNNLLDWSYPETIHTWQPEHKWSNNRLIDPFIVKKGEDFFLFYSGHEHKGETCMQHIGYAVSKDLIAWDDKSLNEPVLKAEEDFELDDGKHGGVENIVILQKEKLYYMVYSAGMRNQKTAIAVSEDLVHWTKNGLISLPVEEWDEAEHGAPYIIDGKEWGEPYYYMWYQGRTKKGRKAVSIGVARSKDLYNWEIPKS